MYNKGIGEISLKQLISLIRDQFKTAEDLIDLGIVHIGDVAPDDTKYALWVNTSTDPQTIFYRDADTAWKPLIIDGAGKLIQADHSQNDDTQPDYIKNRLAWSVPPEVSANWQPTTSFEELLWDGSTNDRARATMSNPNDTYEFYKVSDVYVPIDDLRGGILTLNSDGSEIHAVFSDAVIEFYTLYNENDILINLYIMSTDKSATFSVTFNNVNWDVTIPEAGTYLLKSSESSYVSSIKGRPMLDADNMDVTLGDIGGGILHFNRVSDQILTPDKLIGAVAQITILDLENGEISIQEGTLDSSMIEYAIQLDANSYVILSDGLPIVLLVGDPDLKIDPSLGIPVDVTIHQVGVYFACMVVPDENTCLYVSSASTAEEIHKIDPKYIDVSIDVDTSVYSGSDNPVSSDAVYNFVYNVENNLRFDVSSLGSRVFSVESDCSALDARMIIIENNQNSSGFQKYEAVPAQKFDYSSYDYSFMVEEGYGLACNLFRISTEEFVPEQFEGVWFRSSSDSIVSVTKEVEAEYEGGSFILEGRNILYSSGKDPSMKFSFNFYANDFSRWFTYTYTLENVQKGLYIMRIGVHEKIPSIYRPIDRLEEPIYGYIKISSLYLKLEDEILSSRNAPTTKAVKKAIDSLHSEFTSAMHTLNDSVYNRSEIDSKLSRVYKYKGTVDTYADLPAENNVDGDVWNIRNADTNHEINAGDNVVWNEDNNEWDRLAGVVDLTNYATNSSVNSVQKNVENVQSNVDAVAKDVKSLEDNKLESSAVGNTVASLDSEGLVPKDQLPLDMQNILNRGYFNDANSMFYKEETFLTLIAGELGKFYLDLAETILYIFNGQKFVALSGAGNSVDSYLTDEEYEEIMGGMGL